jgi:hypothetical protein
MLSFFRSFIYLSQNLKTGNSAFGIHPNQNVDPINRLTIFIFE